MRAADCLALITCFGVGVSVTIFETDEKFLSTTLARKEPGGLWKSFQECCGFIFCEVSQQCVTHRFVRWND